MLDTTSDDKNLPIFVTKKWIEVYDQSEKNYNTNKEIRPMLRSDLCNFSDAYIVVKRDITLEGDNDPNKHNKNLAFTNNAPFTNCISNMNGVQIDNAEDLDVVMPILITYNLFEYCKNYKKTTGNLWNYYRGEPSNPLNTDSESFKYKTSILGKTPQNNYSLTNAKVVIALKYLSNFWKNLNIPLINCEI